MKTSKIFEVQLEIIINMKLYEKHVINEVTFTKVNNKLINQLKKLQNNK